MAFLCPYCWIFPKKKEDLSLLNRTERMQMLTKRVHKQSDKLVMAKFSMTLTCRDRYEAALGMFYVVYKEVYELLKEHHDDPHIKAMHQFIEPLLGSRVKGFEQDLKFFWGKNWKIRVDRKISKQYRKYLQYIAETNPFLLLVYFYHLSLALLAGGQAIRKIAVNAFSAKGFSEQVFDYSNLSVKRYELRKDFKDAINHLELSPSEEQLFLDESPKVFHWNNDMVISFETNNSLVRNLYYTLMTLLFSPLSHILLILFVMYLEIMKISYTGGKKT